MATLDYTTRLETAFRAEILPDSTQDVINNPNSFASLLLRKFFTGSKDFIKSSKQLSEHAKTNAKGAKEIAGNAYEVPIIRANMGSLTEGMGTQSITNSAVSFTNKARWTMTGKHLPLAIPDDEVALNAIAKKNSTKVLDIMKEAVDNGLVTMIQDFSTDIFGSNSTAGSNFLSLYAGIANSGITYGDIDRTSVTYWNGNTSAAKDIGTIDTATSANYIFTVMNSMVQTARRNGAQTSNLVFAGGLSVIDAFRNELVVTTTANTGVNGRWDVRDGKGMPGFNLFFNEIPIIDDPSCADGALYLIDMDSTYYVGFPNRTLHVRKWEWDQGNTQDISRITTYGQMVVTNPRRNYYQLWA